MKLIADNSGQSAAVFKRQKAGEFEIIMMSMGKTKSQWVFDVEHVPPAETQLTLSMDDWL